MLLMFISPLPPPLFPQVALRFIDPDMTDCFWPVFFFWPITVDNTTHALEKWPIRQALGRMLCLF